ncbi:MAG: ATP-binding protein [Eubacteriales bacterium]|nr:ATP-binding protein [Eubacteriales bacterium]
MYQITFEILRIPFEGPSDSEGLAVLMCREMRALAADGDMVFEMVCESQAGKPLRYFYSLSSKKNERALNVCAMSLENHLKTYGFEVKKVDENCKKEVKKTSTRAIVKRVFEHTGALGSKVYSLPMLEPIPEFPNWISEALGNGSFDGVIRFQLFPQHLSYEKRNEIRQVAQQASGGLQPAMASEIIRSEAASRWNGLLPHIVDGTVCGFNLLVQSENELITEMVTSRIISLVVEMGSTGDMVLRAYAMQVEREDDPFCIYEKLKNQHGFLATILTAPEVKALSACPSRENKWPFPVFPFSMLERQPFQSKPDETSICIGEDAFHKPVYVSLSQCFTHLIVLGGTGAGKSRFLLVVLKELIKRKIKVIIFDPMGAFQDIGMELGLNVISARRDGGLHINPFIPPEGVTVREWLPYLEDSIEAAFDLPDPISEIVQAALPKEYAIHGYCFSDEVDLKNEDQTPVSLSSLIEIYQCSVRNMSYDDKVRGNISAGGCNRLNSILTTNDVYETIQTVTVSDLLSNNGTVVDLSGMESNARLVAYILLSSLLLYCKTHKHEGVVTIVDETHRLIPCGDSDFGNGTGGGKGNATRAVNSLIRKLLQESRKYRCGFILADQLGSQLAGSGEIVDIARTKVIFNLTGKEAEFASKAVGLENEKLLAHLKIREALLVTENGTVIGFKSAFSPEAEPASEAAFQANQEWLEAHRLIHQAPYELCKSCTSCNGVCDTSIREVGARISDTLFINARADDDYAKTIFMLAHIKGMKPEELKCGAIQLAKKCERSGFQSRKPLNAVLKRAFEVIEIENSAQRKEKQDELL